MMMPWFDRHRRYRHQLSAYLDGELAPPQRDELEGHLAACPSCRRELEELRATAAALRSLPVHDVPRSFALRPEQVAGRARPTLPAPGVVARLAVGGLAFALAVLLVVDLGGLTGGGGVEREAVSVPVAATPTSLPPGAEAEAGEVAAERAQADQGRGEEFGALEEAEEAEPAAAPQEPSRPEPSPAEGAPAAGQRCPSGQPGLRCPGEGAVGIDPLRAAEIALASVLALALAGGLITALAGRKR